MFYDDIKEIGYVTNVERASDGKSVKAVIVVTDEGWTKVLLEKNPRRAKLLTSGMGLVFE